jgi:hypothetical protein
MFFSQETTLNQPSSHFGSADRAKRPQLLFRNPRVFQQKRLHISDDEARVERSRTVDISDAPFSVD